VILDEPTAGLDPVVRRELLETLRGITEDENRSVIISSHITDDLARIADYVTYLVDGKVVMTSAKDELLSNWKRIHFKPGTLEQSVVDSFSNVEEQMFGSSGITRNYTAIQGELAGGIANEEIKVESVDLDDILISLVKEAQRC
jgi:ABC-2 type transport system ATP-binding protein